MGGTVGLERLRFCSIEQYTANKVIAIQDNTGVPLVVEYPASLKSGERLYRGSQIRASRE